MTRESGAGTRRRAACVVHSRRRRGAGAGNFLRLLLGAGTSVRRRGAIFLWWDYQMQRAEMSDLKCVSSENYANQELGPRLELGQEFPRKGNT